MTSGPESKCPASAAISSIFVFGFSKSSKIPFAYSGKISWHYDQTHLVSKSHTLARYLLCTNAGHHLNPKAVFLCKLCLLVSFITLLYDSLTYHYSAFTKLEYPWRCKWD